MTDLYTQPWVKHDNGNEATREIPDYVTGDVDKVHVYYFDSVKSWRGEYWQAATQRTGECTVCGGYDTCDECDEGDLIEPDEIGIDDVDDATSLDDAIAKADAWVARAGWGDK